MYRLERYNRENEESEDKISKNIIDRKKVLTSGKKIILGLLFTGVLVCLSVFTTRKMKTTSEENIDLKLKREEKHIEKPKYTEQHKNVLSGKKGQDFNLNIGMRNDFRMQDCKATNFKQTFPDIDYAFFGYNILRGYPLSNGHDPGFTFPIFKTDYSEGKQTSDCRYSIPHGLVVVPDVSCITSFTSSTAKNKYEFSKSLSYTANVKGGGFFGVSFSASYGYKTSTSEMSSGENVKILSTAKCIYYYTELIQENIPRFTQQFLTWVRKLNKSDDPQTYLDFFHRYGTHYPTYTTFGARLTYEHTMKSSDYQKKTEKGTNVAVQASYSGLFSVSGGFNMDTTQKESISEFSNSVTTRTITVGAPPPSNGDAMTWSSSVKESPVPMQYELSPMHTLFTDKYMGELGVNHKKIAEKMKNATSDYCKYLLKRGLVDSCDPLKPGLMLEHTSMSFHYVNAKAKTLSECIDLCENELDCIAMTYCTECSKSSLYFHVCYKYNTKNNPKGIHGASTSDGRRWNSVIFTFKIKSYVELDKTAVRGISRLPVRKSKAVTDAAECKWLCIRDAYCVAYTFCKCPKRKSKCLTYAEHRIHGLKRDTESTTYFIDRNRRHWMVKPPWKKGNNK
ncbi:uncharacterized protein LOC127704995 [Mytilus californianus]|uniref:uncharacterized protein LOC127704995 n=1 Tax=Mytilus californianus TaxID=6549 RepID=UPI00224794BA|nr:uncharacterized protein LOC127704995 [Mytilus californianus]